MKSCDFSEIRRRNLGLWMYLWPIIGNDFSKYAVLLTLYQRTLLQLLGGSIKKIYGNMRNLSQEVHGIYKLFQPSSCFVPLEFGNMELFFVY
jgi:hypothetical protein